MKKKFVKNKDKKQDKRAGGTFAGIDVSNHHPTSKSTISSHCHRLNIKILDFKLDISKVRFKHRRM